ncbi:MAG: hypothetical protein OEZ38_14245 [Gammaproteobacteria bacterium]|nr:hypothetical protein [Gammaproteobacteria bacterium]
MLHHLQQIIGTELTVNGSQCQLIEILEDGPAMVFMCMDHSKTIQSDQHGGAHRRVQKTYTVPCLSEIHNELHPITRQLLPDEIHAEFLAFLLDT